MARPGWTPLFSLWDAIIVHYPGDSIGFASEDVVIPPIRLIDDRISSFKRATWASRPAARIRLHATFLLDTTGMILPHVVIVAEVSGVSMAHGLLRTEVATCILSPEEFARVEVRDGAHTEIGPAPSWYRELVLGGEEPPHLDRSPN